MGKGGINLKGNALQWACIMLVTMPTFVCYGYNQSVAGGLLTNDQFLYQFPEIDTKHTTGSEKAFNSNIQGTVISLYTAGGIFGALSTCFWGDRLGRRNFIFFSNLVVMIGAILMCSAFDFGQFVAARIVLGLGTGAVSGTVPVWASELAKIESRGAATSLVGFFLSIGIALGFWIDFGLSFVKDNSVSWRFPLAFEIILCLIPMAVIYILPESPRWLLTRGREEEARAVLAKCNDTDPYCDMITTEVNEVKESLEITKSATMRDLFTMGESRVIHRAGLAFLAMFFSQIAAINAITFYANVIFEQYLKMDNIVAQVLSGSMEIVQIIGALLATITIDRMGRRALMMFSGVGMAICMSMLAGCTSVPDNKSALDAAVFALFAINFIYSVGFAGCCFCYSAEVSPLHVRSLVNGFAVATTWSVNFLVAMVTPTAFNSIDYQYYIVWALVNGAFILPLVIFCFPETSRRSLEEIDEIFLQATNFFDVVKIARNLPYRHNKDGTLNAEFDKEKGGQAPVHVEERSESSSD